MKKKLIILILFLNSLFLFVQKTYNLQQGTPVKGIVPIKRVVQNKVGEVNGKIIPGIDPGPIDLGGDPIDPRNKTIYISQL